jgi:hypothetical protein
MYNGVYGLGLPGAFWIQYEHESEKELAQASWDFKMQLNI